MLTQWRKRIGTFILRLTWLLTGLAVTSCGGGLSLADVGSGGTGFITGIVIAAPVNVASVSAYRISNGQMGPQIATASTDSNGRFTLALGGYAGPLLLQASGGTFVDEATGALTTMATGSVMSAVLSSTDVANLHGDVMLTPLTTMAQALASHPGGGMTDANIAVANAAVGRYFSIGDILRVHPINPVQAGAGVGATQDAQNYGMLLAAISQYAQTLGLSNSSLLITAMASDASDGMLNGMSNGMAVQMMGGMALPADAGSTGLAAAMTSFMNSARNLSAVTTPALVSQLSLASGQLH